MKASFESDVTGCTCYAIICASTWGMLLWLPGPAMAAARVLQPLLDTRLTASAASCQHCALLLGAN